MNWPVIPLILGLALIIWSRTGYLSTSGTRVFLMSVVKIAASLAGTALALFGGLLLL